MGSVSEGRLPLRVAWGNCEVHLGTWDLVLVDTKEQKGKGCWGGWTETVGPQLKKGAEAIIRLYNG